MERAIRLTIRRQNKETGGTGCNYLQEKPMTYADGRISEGDLIIPALKLARSTPSGVIATAELIERLQDALKPRGLDAAILQRRQDTRFSQKVRNLISHRNNQTSIFRRGLAVVVPGGMKITEAGLRFLRDEGH
jgi:hypothetical protein